MIMKEAYDKQYVKEQEAVKAKADKANAEKAEALAENPQVAGYPATKLKVTELDFSKGDLAFPFTPGDMLNGTFAVEQEPSGPHDSAILIAIGDEPGDFQNAQTYLGWTTHSVTGTAKNALRVLEAGKEYSLNFTKVKVACKHPVKVARTVVTAEVFG